MELRADEDPIALAAAWLDAARLHEPADAEAAALATANAQGRPSVRMVLVKSLDAQGFTFFTNTESQKGRELAENPFAALCFHWKSLNRQLRAEGCAAPVPRETAEAYFRTRHPLSRLGAWASPQSRPLSSRAALEEKVEAARKTFPGETIPLPPHWGGFRLVPDRLEFWQEGEGRLHNRFLFTRTANGWELTRLAP